MLLMIHIKSPGLISDFSHSCMCWQCPASSSFSTSVFTFVPWRFFWSLGTLLVVREVNGVQDSLNHWGIIAVDKCPSLQTHHCLRQSPCFSSTHSFLRLIQRPRLNTFYCLFLLPYVKFCASLSCYMQSNFRCEVCFWGNKTEYNRK